MAAFGFWEGIDRPGQCCLVLTGGLFLASKKFSILVIPEGSHQVRRYTVKKHWLKALLVFAGISVLGIGLLVFGYLSNRYDTAELVQLRSANLQHQVELARLTDQLELLSRDMVLLQQNDAQVRLLAHLTPEKANVLSGLGGPPEVDGKPHISELQRQIDDVRQQIDLRRQSQEEIQSVLNDQHSLLVSKPQGWPVKGWITSLFGMRKSPFTGRRKMHEGLDIASNTGTPVHTTADGIVARAETAPGYGKLVVIDHGYGYRTYYGHNSRIYVKVGQRVRRGDKIAAVGNTGSSTGSHVHYEVRRNGVPVNPRKYL